MAINSVLNPENIVGRQNTSIQAAQNFISGGSPIGSTIMQSAANKVVDFKRAQVRPATPDIKNIISTITNNISNSVDNSIKNATSITNKNTDRKIQQSTTQIYNQIKQIQSNSPVTQLQTVVQNIQKKANQDIQNTVQKLSESYQKKVNEVDSAKPTGILEKFLSTYRNAISFIQFFSNKKNLDRLSNSFSILKKSFSDSFAISKLIRKVIQKLVKQLTSLPKTSRLGEKGITLDVNLPGGILKKSLPKNVSNMISRRGKMFSLGAASILGAGLAGGATVNALADSNKLKPESIASFIPGNFAAQFADIAQRFSDIILNFLDMLNPFGKGNKSGGSSGSSSSASSGSSSTPSASPGPGTSGPSAYTPGTIPKEVSSDVSFTKGVTELAKKYNVPEDYLYAVMGFETGGTYSPSVKNKAGSGATGLIQFMPDTAKGLGTTTEELSKMSRTEQLKYVDKYFSGTLNKGASLSDVYMSVLMPAAVGKPDSTVLFGPGGIIPGPKAYSQNSGLDSNKDGKVTKAEATKAVEKYLPKSSVSSKPGIGGPDGSLPDFMLPPEKRNQYRNLATNVSQPPPSQQSPQVNFMPISMTGSGQSQRSTPTQMPSSAAAGGGARGSTKAPMISSSNPDNFLILYSKMVYNIVDG